MTSPSLRDLLRAYDLDPKKSLGQNFLADDTYLERIAAGAELTADDAVLEIGPGLGTLTARLAQQAGRVVAVELDDRLISVLRGMFGTRAHVEIVHGDILQLDPGALMGSGSDVSSPYKLLPTFPTTLPVQLYAICWKRLCHRLWPWSWCSKRWLNASAPSREICRF